VRVYLYLAHWALLLEPELWETGRVMEESVDHLHQEEAVNFLRCMYSRLSTSTDLVLWGIVSHAPEASGRSIRPPTSEPVMLQALVVLNVLRKLAERIARR
jgi:hypothetical protein